MVHDQAVSLQMLPILPHVVTDPQHVAVVDGTSPAEAPSTQMPMATRGLVAAVAPLPPAVVAMGSGRMASTLLDQPTRVSSANYSVSPTTQRSSRLVSTLPLTMTSQSRLLDTMFRSQQPSSQTRLWTITSSATSTWLITRFQHLSRSTPFPLLWVVAI